MYIDLFSVYLRQIVCLLFNLSRQFSANISNAMFPKIDILNSVILKSTIRSPLVWWYFRSNLLSRYLNYLSWCVRSFYRINLFEMQFSKSMGYSYDIKYNSLEEITFLSDELLDLSLHVILSMWVCTTSTLCECSETLTWP
jgi:hypothetical protein